MVANSAAILFFMDHTKESCFAVAKKYSRRIDLRDQSSGEYQWLGRNGLLDLACEHMVPVRRKLSVTDIAEIAKNYDRRRSFKLGDQSAYNAAKRLKILDDVCSHMNGECYRSLTDDQIAEIASKSSSRIEFLKNDSAAYQTADKRGILNAVCAHMTSKGDRRLTNKQILAIAKQFTARNDFKLGDFGAYTTAIRRGIIVEACAHMEYGAWGFREDKPAVLYQFRMELPDGAVLFKVGITNRKPSQRLATMGVPRDTKTTLTATIDFPSGRDARIAEKRLHRRFASYRYNGERLMKNGNTELFTKAMLDH